jgi:plastocyanin
MLRLVSTVVIAVAVAALSAGASADTASPLQATVGPGFTISLRDASGAGVSRLDPGTYTIHVVDQSDMHDFHLSGPGVDKATDVTGTGEEDWQVTLSAGTYTYICDVHPTTMRGTFTVGSATTGTALQRFVGGVGPGSKISFVRTAQAGKALLTIHDRSTKDNFHLSGPGVNKKTGVAATGTFSWTVTLRAGTYAFRSDAHAKLRGTTTVS